MFNGIIVSEIGTSPTPITSVNLEGLPFDPSQNVTLDLNSPAPVPEASTTVSFGLLLVLGMGGIVIAAKRKKATTNTSASV